MNKLEGAVNSFGKKRIAIVGDIILDEFVYGIIERTNPEDPIAHVIKISKDTKDVLGGAGNVANNVVSLGAYCDLYGFIGDDKYGDSIKLICTDKSIGQCFSYSKNPTIVKQRIIVQNNRQAARLDYGEYCMTKPDFNSELTFLKNFKQNIAEKKYNGIILSDYDKLVFNKETAQFIINLAHQFNVPVLVDPKPENIEFFCGCTIVRPNEKEAEKITGIRYSNGHGVLEKMAKLLITKLDAKSAFITCGQDGVFCYHQSGENYMIQTRARRVADPTGAGDTFAATLMLGLSSGLDIQTAGELANYASGIVVEEPGTVPIEKSKLLERIAMDYRK